MVSNFPTNAMITLSGAFFFYLYLLGPLIMTHTPLNQFHLVEVEDIQKIINYIHGKPRRMACI